MSSSVGNSSLLNLALLNQLLQRAGVETTDTGTAAAAGNTQESGGTSFSSQADALLNALDADGDGKLSKSELQTGFQKLSQDMRSLLIDQQDIGSGNSATAGTQDSNGTLTEAELESGMPPTQAAGGDGASQLVEQLLAAIGNGGTANNAPLQSTASSQGTTGTSESWDNWVKQMQGSDTGDVANQAAAGNLQRSMALDAGLTQLLQATDISQAADSARL